MQSKLFIVLAALFAVAYVQAQVPAVSSIGSRASSFVASVTDRSRTPLISSASSSQASASASITSGAASASGVVSSANSVMSSLSATASSVAQTGNAANALAGGYSSTLLIQFAALAALFVASFVVMLA